MWTCGPCSWKALRQSEEFTHKSCCWCSELLHVQCLVLFQPILKSCQKCAEHFSVLSYKLVFDRTTVTDETRFCFTGFFFFLLLLNSRDQQHFAQDGRSHEKKNTRLFFKYNVKPAWSCELWSWGVGEWFSIKSKTVFYCCPARGLVFPFQSHVATRSNKNTHLWHF